ncbi:ATP-binding protein [Candidatus Poriferisodalis sp.]|uniref:ATP-binding protein n=1 Tax=Candidatus Poriferisodalis sp. TaxID=3101277 RepID=UPI003B0130D7
MANLLDDRFVEREAERPFAPGFGIPPRLLVGRDPLVASLSAGLDIGPTDDRFSTVILGSRGSGKTVLLGRMKEITAASGWVNLDVDATTRGLHDRIVAEIERACDDSEALPGPVPAVTERTSRRGVGPRLAWLASERKQIFEPNWNLRRRLTTLGRLASERSVGVLITLDELHAADIEELRRFAADMQHISQRGQLPIAVIAAGLPDLRLTFFVDRKLSFFVRSSHADLPHITAAQAYRFFRDSISDAGGHVTEEALSIMADSAGPYPMRMQALGNAAWDCAGSPNGTIDAAAATEAVRHADAYIAARLYPQVWHDVGMSERRLMAALAARDGAAALTDVLADVRGTVNNPAAAWERLLVNECVTEDSYGIAEFGPSMSPEAARSGARSLPEANPGTAATAAAARGSADPTRRCNDYMPRAKRRCVLPAGHNGGCRSRR